MTRLLAAFLLLAAPAHAEEGDARRGEAVFQRCYSCHSVDPAEGSLQGPNLHGVVGRAAGRAEGFEYSEALKAAAGGGLVWTPEAISGFVTNPQAAMPGTAMGFIGLRSAQDRADLLAYLGQQR